MKNVDRASRRDLFCALCEAFGRPKIGNDEELIRQFGDLTGISAEVCRFVMLGFYDFSAIEYRFLQGAVMRCPQLQSQQWSELADASLQGLNREPEHLSRPVHVPIDKTPRFILKDISAHCSPLPDDERARRLRSAQLLIRAMGGEPAYFSHLDLAEQLSDIIGCPIQEIHQCLMARSGMEYRLDQELIDSVQAELVKAGYDPAPFDLVIFSIHWPPRLPKKRGRYRRRVRSSKDE